MKIAMANDSKADLFISLHCNASTSHKAYGSEVYTWKGEQTTTAVKISKEISKLGFFNRGVKDGSGLYVIKHTTMPAILVEMFFLDDESDRTLYQNLGVKRMALALMKGIIEK